MDFYIDDNEALCPHCLTGVLLTKSKELINYCECKNIRVAYCRTQAHITLSKEKKELWYEYKT